MKQFAIGAIAQNRKVIGRTPAKNFTRVTINYHFLVDIALPLNASSLETQKQLKPPCVFLSAVHISFVQAICGKKYPEKLNALLSRSYKRSG